MDIESNTDTQSSYESLLFTKDENQKSPESSDCEGYATPLASSLTDISSVVDHGITINLPEDDFEYDEKMLDSGELTPVSTTRAVSPPIVKQVMFLQKPNILVMTQREINEEEYNVQRDSEGSSEDEFFDVDDEQIRNVAQKLLDAVSESEEEEEHIEEEEEEEEEERVTTPIVVDDVEATYESGSVSPTELDTHSEEDDEVEAVVAEVTEQILTSIESSTEEIVNEIVPEDSIVQIDDEMKSNDDDEKHELSIEKDDVVEDFKTLENVEEITDEEVATAVLVSRSQEDTPESENPVEEVDTSVTLAELVPVEITEPQEDLLESEKVNEVEDVLVEIIVSSFEPQEELPKEEISVHLEETVPVEITQEEMAESEDVIEKVDTSVHLEEAVPVEIVSSCAEPQESEPLLTKQVQKETSVTDAEEMNEEPMPTLVISDEVKTVENTVDDDLSDCSMQEVKVEFDGYSSGKEESLSSSTSTESFEFADSVPSPHSDEKALALRNSIIERYPSNETDDDELDGVEYDEDLLAVKQISAEVEQLVAAINAFGRDEEQQMSAYLVGKKMAAEKKRKSAMETGVSNCQDQLVQTDTDFILVDKHLPEEMESLQVEIDRLQADLDKIKAGEKELLRINGKLQEELQESQQTIDGIEVEAEQQYTELTSEIDELCDIVLKKDQELATLKEKVANLSASEINLKDDVDAQRVIVQRQKEIIESLREELDAITKKLGEVTKLRDKAIEEATIYKMKNMERERFLSKEAQMSMEIEDLQRELNKQKLILNQTSMAKLADTFDRKVLHLENELRERDMLICKQNQIINSHRKSPTGSIITTRKMQPRASVLAAAGNLPSAGSSSESFQNGLDVEAKEALLSFILSDRHNQLANIYNIGRILDLSPQEERAVERHLTKDRFT